MVTLRQLQNLKTLEKQVPISNNKILNLPPKFNPILKSVLKQKDLQILKLTTLINAPINEEMMVILTNYLKENPYLWGLNLGECSFEGNALTILLSEIEHTNVGFLFIEHDNSLKATFQEIIRCNRYKDIEKYQPWFDPKNPVLNLDIAKKFWWNPHNSIHYKTNVLLDKMACLDSSITNIQGNIRSMLLRKASSEDIIQELEKAYRRKLTLQEVTLLDNN